MSACRIKRKEGEHMPKKKATNKQKAYIIDYNQKNYRQISLKFHREYEADELQHLEKQENISQYIKGLIRKDMEK